VHKIPLSISLSILLALTGCGLGPIQAIKSPEEAAVSTIEDTISALNQKYLSLLNIVERMDTFCEEEANIPLPDNIDLMKASRVSAWKATLAASRQTQREFIDSLYKRTLKLINNKQSINDYLCWLLATRALYITVRNEAIEKYLQLNAIAATFPTSKTFLIG